MQGKYFYLYHLIITVTHKLLMMLMYDEYLFCIYWKKVVVCEKVSIHITNTAV